MGLWHRETVDLVKVDVFDDFVCSEPPDPSFFSKKKHLGPKILRSNLGQNPHFEKNNNWKPMTGKCQSPPSQLLPCSSFSKENGHLIPHLSSSPKHWRQNEQLSPPFKLPLEPNPSPSLRLCKLDSWRPGSEKPSFWLISIGVFLVPLIGGIG